jgi:hypothetical protein
VNDELIGDNATLVWDGLSNVQLKYGQRWIKHKSTHSANLAKALGERTVPVDALSGVELTLPKDGDAQLRLVLRENADPVTAVAGARIDELFDPYRFYYQDQQELLAEYYATEIQTAIRLAQNEGPAEKFLVEPPEAPDELKGFDGRLRVDEGTVTFDWSWAASPEKKAAGKRREVELATVTSVEWRPIAGKDLGHVRLNRDDGLALLLGATQQVSGLLFAANLLAKLSPANDL